MKGWWPWIVLLAVFVPSGILFYYYQRNQKRYEASDTRSEIERLNDPRVSWKPMTQEAMVKAGHSEHPGNLNVTVHNVGSTTISSAYVQMGRYKSVPRTLEPSGEFSYLMIMYPVIEPLTLSYKDEQGQIHERMFKHVYRMMPESIQGNFDLTFHVDSSTDKIVITYEDELYFKDGLEPGGEDADSG